VPDGEGVSALLARGAQGGAGPAEGVGPRRRAEAAGNLLRNLATFIVRTSRSAWVIVERHREVGEAAQNGPAVAPEPHEEPGPGERLSRPRPLGAGGGGSAPSPWASSAALRR
jgi:hypothetical protein